MHANERDVLILKVLADRKFVSFADLLHCIPASPATLRRDLNRLNQQGLLLRVRGGAEWSRAGRAKIKPTVQTPVSGTDNLHKQAKAAIGRVAVHFCHPGDAVIIAGGSTTLQMCPYLEPLGLSVLTNSLPIVSALLPQPNTDIILPGGELFREQNVVLNPFDDLDDVAAFHATRMFFSCAAFSHYGPMQSDIILAQVERKLFRQADSLVILADSSKFSASAGHLLCDFKKIQTLITDEGVPDACRLRLEKAGVNLVTVPVDGITPPSELCHTQKYPQKSILQENRLLRI